jgi:glutathione S-transferase
MTGITVYGIPGSPFLRSVEVTLKEKGLDYHLQVMAPVEHKGEEHLKLHPFGKVPAFEHDGLAVYETQAILRYVDDRFPNPPLTPGVAPLRARMNQVIGIIECYFFPKAATPIAFNRIIGPKLLGLPSDEAAIEEAMPMARTCFAELDRLLGDKPYFTGSNVSLADIMLGAQLDLLCDCHEGHQLIDETANLEGWLDRMRSRPSFAQTLPPEALRAAA